MTVAIGFVLFPNVTQLDLTGPLQVFSRTPKCECHLVARSLAHVPTDTALDIPPTTTFADCPPLDLICVPGGQGVPDAIRDPETLAFVMGRGAEARWVTSVCTGAFLLGAAGLLQNKRATTHWAYRDLLPLVGARPGAARVIQDGNVVTGGGVTAGIDFALSLAAELASPGVAQSIQLTLEYDPAPPFDAGSPKFAPEPIRERVSGFYETARQRMREAIAP
jgi:cyclohexyl-isocyanide hydratase